MVVLLLYFRKQGSTKPSRAKLKSKRLVHFPLNRVAPSECVGDVNNPKELLIIHCLRVPTQLWLRYHFTSLVVVSERFFNINAINFIRVSFVLVGVLPRAWAKNGTPSPICSPCCEIVIETDCSMSTGSRWQRSKFCCSVKKKVIWQKERRRDDRRGSSILASTNDTSCEKFWIRISFTERKNVPRMYSFCGGDPVLVGSPRHSALLLALQDGVQLTRLWNWGNATWKVLNIHVYISSL